MPSTPSTPSQTFSLLLFLFLGYLSLSNATLRLSGTSPLTKISPFAQPNGLDYVVLHPRNQIAFRRFRGSLLLASPKDDACNSVQPISASGDNDVSNPIVLATWGGCNYARKVKNAELAGAKMLILVLEDGMPLNHQSLRQLPIRSSIEVLAITKKDGDSLIEILKEAQSKPKSDAGSVVELNYLSEPERNINYDKKGVVDFWITTNDVDNGSYEYLTNLEGVLSDFGASLKFYPRYVLWENKDLIKRGEFYSDENCVSGGRYCDPDADSMRTRFNEGKGAVLETLRQICLRDIDQAVWWKYVGNYASVCTGAEGNNCEKNVFRDAGIAENIIEKVNACMRDSFGVSNNEDLGETLKDNSKLKAEVTALDEMSINKYPSLYINGIEYMGNMRNRTMLTDFICSQFSKESAPGACYAGGRVPHTWKDIGVYVGVFLGCAMIMVVLLYCMRIRVKRDVMIQLNNEIPNIITHYKRFKDMSISANTETQPESFELRSSTREEL